MRAPQAPRAKHLFTDASCIRQFHGISAWAGMLVDGCDSTVRSKLIGTKITNATLAEFYGVRLALRTFYRQGEICDGDTIMLHCDSAAVCTHIGRQGFVVPQGVKHKPLAEQIEQIAAFIDDHSIVVCTKWVKAHQSYLSDDWRELINKRVDMEARNLTRAECKRIRGKMNAKRG